MKHRTWTLCTSLAILLLGCWGCAAIQRNGQPFSTPFGVGVALDHGPVRAAQLDAIGPVWYMDWRWDTPTEQGRERLYIVRCWEVEPDQGAIPSSMRASGSAWWSLGNEPNDPNQDNVSPEEYAELYHTFEGWARTAPGCRIVPAGLANADWKWAAAFREAFREKYGRYPHVDGWNIHDYILEPGLDPYDVGEFQRRIVDFYEWMDAIGDGHKPLLLTEFGVLYGDGCCGRPVDPPEKIQAFMRKAVRWLLDSEIVACWAWFSAHSEVYNGDLMTREGQLTDLGAIYRELLEES